VDVFDGRTVKRAQDVIIRNGLIEAVAAGGAGTAAADLSQDWELIYGAGYYQAHVKGNRFYSRALLSGSTGATLVAEIVGDYSYHFTGAARDSHGNVYKVTFGE
jgi:hypothetical protein